MTIIGILSAVLFPSVTGYLRNARDTRKKLELQQLNTGLMQHQWAYGTFKVSGAWYAWAWQWWINYVNPTQFYPKSLLQALQDEGYVGNSIKQKTISDVNSNWPQSNISPCVPSWNSIDLYMLYFDDTIWRYSLSATLENSNQSNIDDIVKSYNGMGANGTCTRYGRNYAIWE